MEHIRRIIAVGYLTSFQMRQGRKGSFVTGILLCVDSKSQKEIPFMSFKKSILRSQRKNHFLGERVKIIGSISSVNGFPRIIAYRIGKTKIKRDWTDVACIGILKEIREQEDGILNLIIEAKTFYQGKIFLHNLEVKTRNERGFKEKLLMMKETNVFMKGTLVLMNKAGQGMLACWLRQIIHLDRKNIERKDEDVK